LEQNYGKRKRKPSGTGKVNSIGLEEASHYEGSEPNSFSEIVKNMSPLWREFYLKFEAKIKKY